MNRKERIVKQRALVREALGKLYAAIEYFGAEDRPYLFSDDVGYKEFVQKVNDLEDFMLNESDIA